MDANGARRHHGHHRQDNRFFPYHRPSPLELQHHGDTSQSTPVASSQELHHHHNMSQSTPAVAGRQQWNMMPPVPSTTIQGSFASTPRSAPFQADFAYAAASLPPPPPLQQHTTSFRGDSGYAAAAHAHPLQQHTTSFQEDFSYAAAAPPLQQHTTSFQGDSSYAAASPPRFRGFGVIEQPSHTQQQASGSGTTVQQDHSLAARRGVDVSPQGLQDLVAALEDDHSVKPLSKAYQRHLDRSMKSLRDYLDKIGFDLRMLDSPNATPLSAAQWKGYITRYAASHHGMLSEDGALSLKRVHQMMSITTRAYERLRHSTPVASEIREQVSAYINGELKERLSLSTAAREKTVGTAQDFLYLLETIYSRREQMQFTNNYDRLAFTGLLQLIVFTCSRPGDVIQSPSLQRRWTASCSIVLRRSIILHPNHG